MTGSTVKFTVRVVNLCTCIIKKAPCDDQHWVWWAYLQKLQTEMGESLIPVGFRGFGDKSIYSAAMRWCSSINLWFSSSSFLLWRSKAFPLWRLWTSNSLTASVGSGTAFSSTEPILNLKQGHNKSGSDLLITLKPSRGTHTEGIHITIDGSYFFEN